MHCNFSGDDRRLRLSNYLLTSVSYTPALRRSCYFQLWILLLLSPLSSLDKNSLLYWTFSITSLIVTRCCQLYSNQRLLQGTFRIWHPLCEAPCEVLLNMKSQRGTGMARKPHATKNNQVMPNFKSHHEVKKQWMTKVLNVKQLWRQFTPLTSHLHIDDRWARFRHSGQAGSYGFL